MKHYKLLFAVFSLTLLAFAGWFSILYSIDPYQTDWFSRVMFFFFLLVFLWGTIALAMYYWRKKEGSSSSRFSRIKACIRQGLVLSAGVVGLLVLKTIDVLNILSASVYIIALILIELFFRFRKENYA